MEIAKIYVNGTMAAVSGLKKIPKGIAGATITVAFGNDWDGLTKTAVFQGAVTKDVLGIENVITIPAECVEQSGHRLKVGFYGVADETLVIPTLWADLGTIQDATDPSGDTSTDPALPVWAQMQEQIKKLEEATARIAEINLLADKWVGGANQYSQVVEVEGATENSQVDITPNVEQLVIFYEKDLTFVTENDGGVVTVYAIGQKPTNDYTIQVTITEVAVHSGKIIGVTVGTALPKPNLMQTDPTKGDYIKGKTEFLEDMKPKKGVDYFDGQDGKSAYQIALDNGFEGTKEEWLASLKGDKGDKGDKGEQGIQGIQGIQGVKGDSGDAYEAPPIVCPRTGEVITLADSAERPLHGMSLYGKTIQNGTPTPDAPVELESVGEGGSVAVTVCGKNLLNMPEKTLKYVGVKVQAKESEVVFSGTSTSVWGDIFLLANNVWFPNGTYTLSVKNLEKITELQVNVYDESGTEVVISRRRLIADYPSVTFTMEKTFTMKLTFVLPANAVYGSETNPTKLYIQLEPGMTATEYEPYNGQSLTAATPNGLPGIPVSSGGNYTDENGQAWVCDEIDFARGKYVQRVGSTKDKQWVQKGVMSGTTGERYSVTVDVKAVQNIPVLCTHYPFMVRGSWGNPGDYVASDEVHKTPEIHIRSTRIFGGAEAFNKWATENRMFVLYPLATPIEIDLTVEEIDQYSALHTNYPNTTIYNDEGAGMAVKYVADTKMYIDNKFAELATAILNA